MALKLVGGNSDNPETEHRPLKIGGGIDSNASTGHLVVRGRTVCYAGRLATMGHEAFVDVVTRHGATFGQADGAGGVIVVGEADWPLVKPAGARGGSGGAANQLKTMETLDRKARAGARVIGEREFFAALGLEQYQADQRQLFSTATLTHLLDISRERIRAWVKAELIRPITTDHGVWQFDFRQVAAVRTLCELTRAGVATDKIRRALTRLRQWMPELAQPLEQLATLERNGPLLVRLEAGELAEPDGQFHFEFDVTSAPAPAQPGSAPANPMRILAGPRTAAEWSAQGLEQEREGYLEEAAASYRQALLAGGPDAVTCFNLANVLRALGNKPQALERYAQVVETDPTHGDGWNNLGTLLAELAKPEEACDAFRKALAVDRDDARAHYNLADTLEEMGRSDEARAHWEAYLRYDGQSQWADHARRRLE